jgi:hypothetical protein
MLAPRLHGLPGGATVEPKTGWIQRVWADWLRAVAQRVDASPFRVQTVSLTAQGAAIVATSVPITDLVAGLYRVTYALRITRPGTVSSSATVTLGWTDGTVACSQAFAAVTGNTTAKVQSGTVLMRCDGASSLTYAVVYASAGATAMQFQIDVTVEYVPGSA